MRPFSAIIAALKSKMSSGLHHIAILCSDKANALRFYCDALGFEVVREVARPERGDEIVWLSGYGLVLELFIAPNHPTRINNPEAYGLRHLVFRCLLSTL